MRGQETSMIARHPALNGKAEQGRPPNSGPFLGTLNI